MLDAAIKALHQMFSPPFRSVLFKSILLALVMIVLFGIGLHRVLVWLVENGGTWAESALGSGAQGSVGWAIWFISIAAGFGIIVGGIFLMPAVTAFVGSFFVDAIAELVERQHYPSDPPGNALPFFRSISEGAKTALLAVIVYLCALPFLLVAGLGLVILFLAAAYLLSREYFELAAMRFHSPTEAKSLRKAHQGRVFTAGILIAIFVSIPIINLATPLFGMALMVHMHKKLAGSRTLIEARAS
jgi:uncharacterized protein involved in cysteine biosynthesis